MKDKYRIFIKKMSFLPPERLLCGEQARLAWGTDAGFYRLIPKVIVFPEKSEEVARILQYAGELGLPVTFRASGTSLSGQAISDSILVVTAHYWEKCHTDDEGETVYLQPGAVGEHVNHYLKSYGRKISPDPASLKSARIGGIVMNNASGMRCGTHANVDKMIVSAEIILSDGSIIETGSASGRAHFMENHRGLLMKIEELRDKVRQNEALVDRIKHKYSIKNVMGLNILPFVTYDDPIDIVTHLMVGSEGTLGFLAGVTLKTEPLCSFSASAMVYFRSLKDACLAIADLKPLVDPNGRRLVVSAELLDAKALACVHDPVIEQANEGLTALLLETQAQTAEQLHAFIDKIQQTLSIHSIYLPVSFTSDEAQCARFWEMRSGIFPTVGGNRSSGTTALIEDVAFHDKDMPDAIADLQRLLEAHGYLDACIYGHALDGNVHFILNQSFNEASEVRRYEKLMQEVVELTIHKYDGSLKAEHGTGRNMAPYLKAEWGEDAFELMQSVKTLFDPLHILNPGVIFNDDPHCHIKHLKPLPLTHPIVDKCIECGFCEVNCPTCGFTLSPRQRIVIQREITRLTETGENKACLRKLKKQYRYAGEQTCAGDGLCAMACPMGINIGDLTHILRYRRHPKGSFVYRVGEYTARHLSLTKKMLRLILRSAHIIHIIIGTRLMKWITHLFHSVLKFPLWTPAMPKAIKQPTVNFLNSPSDATPSESPTDEKPAVVYFPSCLNQTMGLEHHSLEQVPLVQKTISLLEKAGYRVIFPERMAHLCCGMIWESKGMEDIADEKTVALETALWKASCEGAYPILCDQSPCLYRMRDKIKRLQLYEPIEFIYKFLRDKLDFHPIETPILIHITCSMHKMGLAAMFNELAALCSNHVITSKKTGCCGFAGDKGFTHPEVNKYALHKLYKDTSPPMPPKGYCNSRTCEIGLTTHLGVPFQSIVYLIDACTTPNWVRGRPVRMKHESKNCIKKTSNI